MSVNISKLKRNRSFENEKIKITFTAGSVSNSFSVYLFDQDGKRHHVLWEILPDRCHQNFDKTNGKVRAFVQDKIDEWVNDEVETERLREKAKQEQERREDNKLKELMESF